MGAAVNRLAMYLSHWWGSRRGLGFWGSGERPGFGGIVVNAGLGRRDDTLTENCAATPPFD